ncbi:LacI family DNA-binding transcriptional regulator [Fulvivirga sedimenti]|uniref:LacI family transcriptional regulator n=1 Tax=Fulvivirga sedimenti TaxID=2879465 RepID=A0A9X1L2D8_9BACT|nr:LacI family DNA-binding transcriptional regulator [Fulvivirga sedimenti]MCA6079187.1 LacI family transcriptional regulator [Fulvivirga sedimenti]
MKSTQITIKDIARELGISPSTVSRALKDHPDISPETKKAVNKLAEELNYQPNSIALSLRHRKSNTIGVIIPEIVHFFFSTVISGIEDIAYGAGYSVIISQSNESYEREVMDTKAMFNNRVDGIIVSMSRETQDLSHFESIHKRGMPMVFFDRSCDLFNCSNVLVDDINGGYQATSHLIEQGCRRIVHLQGPSSLTITRDRHEGYKKALAEHNIPYNKDLVINDEMGNDEQSAKDIFGKFFDTASEKPDGVFASTDMIALGAIQALKARGLRVPEDVCVVGFSNWQFTSLTEPTITTVAQPGFEMGQEAARLLIREIEADEDTVLEPVLKTLKTTLIIRDSSTRKK